MLSVRDLSFDHPGRNLFAGVSFDVGPGEFMSVVGPSGTGKSTLLNCVVGILRPQGGSVTVDGTRLTDLPTSARAGFRLRHIGMVFQFGELLPELPVVENVALPLLLAGMSRDEARDRARETLESVGLASRSTAMPETLSGGEVQRTAIARALVARPALIVADEPTGMLDTVTSASVVAELRFVARTSGAALVVVTHDERVAAGSDLRASLRDGRLSVEGAADLDDARC